MVEHLKTSLFPYFSPMNRVRCFLHVVNLVAKSFLHQFDLKKKDANEEWVFDEEDPKFKEILEDFDEAKKMFDEGGDSGDDEDEESGDDVEPFEGFDEADGEEPQPDDLDGWVDEIEELSAEDLRNLQENRKPVKLVLFKV